MLLHVILWEIEAAGVKNVKVSTDKGPGYRQAKVRVEMDDKHWALAFYSYRSNL